MKVNDGGGIDHEQENIEVLEIKLYNAMQMVETGEIKDGKTIMLLQYLKLNKFSDDCKRLFTLTNFIVEVPFDIILLCYVILKRLVKHRIFLAKKL